MRSALSASSANCWPALGADGRVITRWDGKTTKAHAVTGEKVASEAPVRPPTIGIDANVLLRLLLGDDPPQSALTEAWLRTVPPQPGQIHVGDVVLAEACWMLASVYQQPKMELVRALRALLDEPMFSFDDPATLDAAVTGFEQVACSVADCLIVARNAARRCSATVTFDQRMARLPGTRALSPGLFRRSSTRSPRRCRPSRTGRTGTAHRPPSAAAGAGPAVRS